MKKEILKPFDLEKAKQGARLVTNEGYPARIICWDCDSEDYKIVALVHVDGRESPVMFMENGISYMCGSFNDKLQIVEEVGVSDRWRDRNENVTDYVADSEGKVQEYTSTFNYSIGYASEKEALREYASRKISHIIANDERFGGVVTAEEYKHSLTLPAIVRGKDIDREPVIYSTYIDTTGSWQPLLFHTLKQADLFLDENMDLLKQYFML